MNDTATCIVGLVHDGTVWIAGDSAGIGWNYSKQIRADEKVFTKPPYVFGFTTSFRMGQLIRYCINLPTPPMDPSKLMQFMVKDFVNAIRNGFRDGGFLHKEQDQEVGGELLVGVGGRLFQIYDNFQVAEMRTQGAACGCGVHLALGALSMGIKRKPLTLDGVPDLLLDSLTIVAQHSAGVHEPFEIVSGGTITEIKKANEERF